MSTSCVKGNGESRTSEHSQTQTLTTKLCSRCY